MILPYRSLFTLALFGLISSSALAVPDKKTEKTEAPAKTNAVDKPADSSVAETIIPELSFQGVQLEDVIDFLQDSIPSFKAIVIRDPGVAADVPSIRMRLKKVSLDQFLELITTAYPVVEVSPVIGAGGTVYVIKVRPTDEQWRRAHGAGEPLGAVGGGGGGGGVPPQLEMGVRVYALGPYIKYLIAAHPGAPKDQASAAKEAVNQILSLIKATLAQVGDSGTPQPVIQVHDETQTLIVKGTSEQQSVLTDVLAQLMPLQPAPQLVRNEKLAEMEKLILSTRMQLEERDKMASSQAAEIEHLRVRLESMERAKNSNDPKPSVKTDKSDSPQQ